MNKLVLCKKCRKHVGHVDCREEKRNGKILLITICPFCREEFEPEKEVYPQDIQEEQDFINLIMEKMQKKEKISKEEIERMDNIVMKRTGYSWKEAYLKEHN